MSKKDAVFNPAEHVEAIAHDLDLFLDVMDDHHNRGQAVPVEHPAVAGIMQHRETVKALIGDDESSEAA